MRTNLLLAALLALAFACGKESKSVSQLLQAWKSAGLEPSAFQKADTQLGGKCQAGLVSGVDTIVCEFKDEAAAKAAEGKALEVIGETTGASLAKGRMLLVVADRRNADPNGKQIQKITKTFRQ